MVMFYQVSRSNILMGKIGKKMLRKLDKRIRANNY
jgi:hypothetical protein